MNESASNKKGGKKTTAKKAAPKATKPAVEVKAPAATCSSCPAPAPAAPAPKPAPKATPAASVTTIVAKVDVGFGNTLYLRGTGPGLSWEKGVEMTNAGADEWTWSTNKASKTFLAKVLINDSIWSGDPDATIVPGTKTVIQATF